MKKIFIVALAVVVLLGAGYGISLYLKNKNTSPVNLLQSDKTDQENKFNAKTSIKNLLTRGKALKCTFEKDADDESEGGQMKGVTYIANGKVRNDIKITTGVNGETMEMHSIVNDGWVYSWPIGEGNRGMKIKAVENEDNNQDYPSEMANIQNEFAYQCSRWSLVDNKKFVPPADVDFQDYSNMMEGFRDNTENANTENSSQNACQTCDNMPNETLRNECRQSIGCD